MGINTESPNANAACGNRTLLDHHRDHLRTSGLSDETIAAAGFFSVTDPKEAADMLGWDGPKGPAPAIAIPYRGRSDEIITHVLRPDDPRPRKNGKAPKYEWPVGQKSRLFFPPHALVPPSRYDDVKVPLILIEGVKKVLKVSETRVDLAPISGQGTTIWHDIEERRRSDVRRLHPDLDGIPLVERTIFVGFDGGDTTNGINVMDAEARLARMLLDAGADARLLRIPFEKGQKAGIDDFLVSQKRPAAVLRRLLKEAIPADPILRVRAISNAKDPAAAALVLLRDKSFAASLRVAPPGVLDIVAREMKRGAGISKDAVRNAAEEFGKLLAAAARRESQESTPDDKGPSPELLAEARNLLKDPQLIDRFHHTLEQRGLVGERPVAQVILLSGVSRKTRKPIHVVVKAASSAGKNFVVEHVIALFPQEDVLVLSDITPRALNYMVGGIRHKLVVIVEQAGAERAEYPLRLAMSEGRITTLVTEKVEDAKGTHMEARQHVVEGPAAFVLTTTRGLLHDENETRIIEVNLDESQDQTGRILATMAKGAAEPESAWKRDQADQERDLWRLALGMLDGCPVIIPQAPDLVAAFPKNRVRARRDFAKLLALIEAHALLHQFQRTVDEEGRVLATDADVQAALRLGQMLREDVSPRFHRIATSLHEAFGCREFTPSDAAKLLGYVDDAARKILRELERVGLVELTSSQRGSTSSRWKVIAPGTDNHAPDVDAENRHAKCWDEDDG